MKHLLLGFTVTLLLAGCAEEAVHVVPPVETESARLNTWLDAEFDQYLDFRPLAKTALGIKTDYDKLDDVSDAALDKRLEWRRASVAEMKTAFDRSKLDAEAQRSYDLWLFLLEREEKALPYRHHDYVFGRRGPHTGLVNSLINNHKVADVADMQAYISRLTASGTYLRQSLTRARLSAEAGIRAPYFDYDIAISQIGRVTKGVPFTDEGESAIWKDVSAKADALATDGRATADQVIEFKAAARAAILQHMKPAYDDILAWLETDRTSVPVEATGAWALPNGQAFYDHELESMTTLPLTADQIHETGLVEVARIQAEMNRIREKVGFEGDLRAFFDHLREGEQFYLPNTDEGREQYLELARQYTARMQEKLPQYFGILPQGPLEVRRVEAFREQAGGAAHYSRGTKDGSRPGIFYVHLADMRAASTYRLENLAYHEAVPGHHLQIAIQQELEGIPRFRTYHGFTAFSEGWGLYSEYIGKEMGFYQDPYSDFGRLTGEIWRAIRLVVDTGIHARKWTEQQAIDYALTNSPRPEGAVRAEIRRYFNNPGQATAYKIGMLEIQRLRAHAEEKLGSRFDIRRFHDVVLDSGSLPMSLLGKKVEAWVAGGGD
ncbi:MAG: DUF885 domain-containing protein [Proteobacteria bacterium]|nr:DUF885 domain-containing protein [Pseudomonadota bacterium]